jgi:hypothetical protein
MAKFNNNQPNRHVQKSMAVSADVKVLQEISGLLSKNSNSLLSNNENVIKFVPHHCPHHLAVDIMMPFRKREILKAISDIMFGIIVAPIKIPSFAFEVPWAFCVYFSPFQHCRCRRKVS